MGALHGRFTPQDRKKGSTAPRPLPSPSSLCKVEAVDFGRLGIEQQLRVVRSADVMVGYHGAALTLSLFMPPESALVEIEGSFRCGRAGRVQRGSATHS